MVKTVWVVRKDLNRLKGWIVGAPIVKLVKGGWCAIHALARLVVGVASGAGPPCIQVYSLNTYFFLKKMSIYEYIYSTKWENYTSQPKMGKWAEQLNERHGPKIGLPPTLPALMACQPRRLASPWPSLIPSSAPPPRVPNSRYRKKNPWIQSQSAAEPARARGEPHAPATGHRQPAASRRSRLAAEPRRATWWPTAA